MLDRLTLPALPALRGQRVILRGPRESDVDDRLHHPIDPEEEDGYGSAWRREWDGRRYHTREHLTAARGPPTSNAYRWAVEYDRHCIGSAGRLGRPLARAEGTAAAMRAAARPRGDPGRRGGARLAIGSGDRQDCASAVQSPAA